MVSPITLNLYPAQCECSAPEWDIKVSNLHIVRLILLTLRLGRRLKCSICVRCSSEETWKLFQTIECRMENWNIVAAS